MARKINFTENILCHKNTHKNPLYFLISIKVQDNEKLRLPKL